MHKALVNIGINPGHEELQYYFKLFDKDNDNTISYEEFSSIIKDFLRKEMSSANDFLHDLRREFKAADTTNQRALRANQIKLVFQNLGIQIPDEDIDTLFKEID
jgi:Ca2+-binding EF-hand superfamily protein